nr:hypothetical protein [Streptomyces mutabilis]
MGEEVIVELGGVGDQHPALQQGADALGHLLEGGASRSRSAVNRCF